MFLALQAQQAAMLAALQCYNALITAWLRMLKGETEIMQFPAHRRAEELHKAPPVIATGPTWTDHYGRRAHDVDVEHMR
jgi:hypothetical protein